LEAVQRLLELNRDPEAFVQTMQSEYSEYFLLGSSVEAGSKHHFSIINGGLTS
jgi:hypothetical protein